MSTPPSRRRTDAAPAQATRRTVLRGVGATLVLPFLPSALPRSAWGSTATAPTRLLIGVMPNGLFTPRWEPTVVGPDYVLSDILTPAALLKDRMTVVSGLKNRAEEAYNSPEHNPAMGSLLTDTPVGFEPGNPNGISVDQVGADFNGALTPFRSLQFGVDTASSGGEGTYSSTVSWGNSDTPYSPIEDPRTMFNRLFGTDSGLTPEQAEAYNAMRGSVLDRVAERTASLKPTLSSRDQLKLEQYETGVRELELQLDRLADIVCEEPATPVASPGLAEATTAMYDLMFKAYECDLSRYVTFMQGGSASDQVFGHLGITTSHHSLSHSAWGAGGVDEGDYVRINQWELEMFCGLVQRLADTEDVDGSDILSNTIAVFTTEFSDSNFHVAYGTYALPVALFGGENLGLVQGQHRRFAEEAHGSLWLTLLHHLGIEQASFGSFGTKVLSLT